ncbi:MAG: hypothetical protein AB4042_14015 [Leptolyngbyaceae cyanobacterium]
MQPSQPRPRKLPDQVRDVIRLKHYSYPIGPYLCGRSPPHSTIG